MNSKETISHSNMLKRPLKNSIALIAKGWRQGKGLIQNWVQQRTLTNANNLFYNKVYCKISLYFIVKIIIKTQA